MQNTQEADLGTDVLGIGSDDVRCVPESRGRRPGLPLLASAQQSAWRGNSGNGDQQKPEWAENSLGLQGPLSRVRGNGGTIAVSCRSSFRTLRLFIGRIRNSIRVWIPPQSVPAGQVPMHTADSRENRGIGRPAGFGPGPGGGRAAPPPPAADAQRAPGSGPSLPPAAAFLGPAPCRSGHPPPARESAPAPVSRSAYSSPAPPPPRHHSMWDWPPAVSRRACVKPSFAQRRPHSAFRSAPYSRIPAHRTAPRRTRPWIPWGCDWPARG